MKKILLFLLILPALVFGATGDIIGFSVNTDGKSAAITYEGLSTGGTHATGFGAFHNPNGAKGKLAIKRLSFGLDYSPSTLTDTIYIDTVYNKCHPNSASDSAVISGSDVIVTYALSHPVFIKDTIKYISIASGLYTQGGTPSAVYTATSGTNNSAENYPPVCGNWIVVDRTVQTDSVRLWAKVAHISGRYWQPVRGITYTVSDQHSHTASVTINVPSRYAYPVTGLYGDAYYGAISTSSFTDGDTLIANFTAFPWYGDSAASLNTADGVNAYPSPLYCPRVFQLNKAGAYPTIIAVIDSINGNNATGVIMDSSTANPDTAHAYQDIGSAINAAAAFNNTNHGHNDAGGLVCFVKSPQNVWVGTACSGAGSTEPNTWITIQPYPGYTRDQINIVNKANATAGVPGMIHLRNITYSNSIATIFTAIKYMWIDACSLNVSGTAPFYVLSYTYWTDNKIIRIDDYPYSTSTTSPVLWRGNLFSMTSAKSTVPYTVVGNKCTSPTARISFKYSYTGQTVPQVDNMVFCDNWMSVNDYLFTSPYIGIDSVRNVGRLMMVQNLVEKTTATNPVLLLAADNSRSDSVKNIILCYNSIIGQRTNLFYNDPATQTSTVQKQRKLLSVRHNIFSHVNIVGDGDTHNGGPTGGITGNYSARWGSNWTGNVFGGFTYKPKNSGLLSNDTSGLVLGSMTLGFVADKSYTGTAAGNGDYRLKDGTPGTRNNLAVDSVYNTLRWDINGNRRRLNGAAGPYESLDTLALFYGIQSVGVTTIAHPCSTLSKISGDSVMIYLQYHRSDSLTWKTADSTPWTTSVLHDTLNISGLSGNYKYYERLYAKTTAKFGPHYDSTSTFDSATTLPGGPLVSSVSPSNGPTVGGIADTVNGSSFGAVQGTGAYVHYGVTDATIVSWSDIKIATTTPAKTRGTYKVFVSDSSGHVDSSQTFQYEKPCISYAPSTWTDIVGVPTVAPAISSTCDAFDSVSGTIMGYGSLNHATGAITGTPLMEQASTEYTIYAWQYGLKLDSTSINVSVIYDSTTDQSGVWSSTGSTDMNDPANYTWSVRRPTIINAHDTLKFDTTAGGTNVNCEASGDLSCRSVTVTNYKGELKLNNYTLSVENDISLSNTASYSVLSGRLFLKGTGTVTMSKPGLQFGRLQCGQPSHTTTFVNNSGGLAGATNLDIGTGIVNLPLGSYLYWAPSSIGDTFMTSGTGTTFSGAGKLYVVARNTASATYTIPLASYTQTGGWIVRKYDNPGTVTFHIQKRIAQTPSFTFYNQLASSSMTVQIDSTIIVGGGRTFAFGSSSASATAVLILNADTISCSTFDLSTYNSGTIKDSLKTCKINTGGAAIGTNHDLYAGTSRIVFDDTTQKTFVTSGKTLHEIMINKSGNGGITQNGKISALSYTIQDGYFYATNATDTINLTGHYRDTTGDSTYIPVLYTDSLILRHARKKIGIVHLSVCDGMDTAGYGGTLPIVYHPSITSMSHVQNTINTATTCNIARSYAPTCAYLYIDSAIVASGSLPTGTSMTKTGATAGAITGTPSDTGTYTWTTAIYYNYGSFQSVSDTITVTAGAANAKNRSNLKRISIFKF